ncbi:hypothetical protein LXL04_023557 [Taraxacum kok-saghyz]
MVNFAAHGQLYVALSRGISRANTKVLLKPHEKTNDDEVYTSNVVNSAGLFRTRFLTTHPTSEDTLDISRNYRGLPELGNWFQLNCSFL